jgi:hypothetical protein
MEKLWAIISACYHGKELTNAAGWKNKQMAVNAIMTILAPIPLFIPNLNLSDEQMQVIAAGIFTVGNAFSLYLTAATSSKVGLRSSKK